MLAGGKHYAGKRPREILAPKGLSLASLSPRLPAGLRPMAGGRELHTVTHTGTHTHDHLHTNARSLTDLQPG